MTTRATNDLTKLTVYLVPSAMHAMDEAARMTGDSKTDTVNRALQLYLTLVQAAERGERVLLSRRRFFGLLEVRKVLRWDTFKADRRAQ